MAQIISKVGITGEAKMAVTTKAEKERRAAEAAAAEAEPSGTLNTDQREG